MIGSEKRGVAFAAPHFSEEWLISFHQGEIIVLLSFTSRRQTCLRMSWFGTLKRSLTSKDLPLLAVMTGGAKNGAILFRATVPCVPSDSGYHYSPKPDIMNFFGSYRVQFRVRVSTKSIRMQ
jgi:hypothetical protein